MNRIQKKVLQFHKKYDMLVNKQPTIPDKDIIKLRLKLIKEEFKELKKAIKQKDIVEIADAIGDLEYVLHGAAISFGMDIAVIVEEIHNSNMTKSKNKNSDGKIVGKAKGFKPPKLKPLLKKMRLDI